MWSNSDLLMTPENDRGAGVGAPRPETGDEPMSGVRPEKIEETETGFRLVNRLDLPPGRYQIRVAAHDGGVGIDGDVVLDGGVAFLALQLVSGGQ